MALGVEGVDWPGVNSGGHPGGGEALDAEGKGVEGQDRDSHTGTRGTVFTKVSKAAAAIRAAEAGA